MEVTVRRRIHKPDMIEFLMKAEQTFSLTQRERIALGLLAQRDELSARQLAELLELPDVASLHGWLEGLLKHKIVRQMGKGEDARYFVESAVLHKLVLPDYTKK